MHHWNRSPCRIYIIAYTIDEVETTFRVSPVLLVWNGVAQIHLTCIFKTAVAPHFDHSLLATWTARTSIFSSTATVLLGLKWCPVPGLLLKKDWCRLVIRIFKWLSSTIRNQCFFTRTASRELDKQKCIYRVTDDPLKLSDANILFYPLHRVMLFIIAI